jgi:hypothetical protein
LFLEFKNKINFLQNITGCEKYKQIYKWHKYSMLRKMFFQPFHCPGNDNKSAIPDKVSCDMPSK